MIRRLLGGCFGYCLETVSTSGIYFTPFTSGKSAAYESDDDERLDTLHYFNRAASTSTSRSHTPHTDEQTADLIDIDGDRFTFDRGPEGVAPNIVVSRVRDDSVGPNSSVGTESPFSVGESSPVRTASSLGKLMVAVLYHPDKKTLDVTVQEAYEVAVPDSESLVQVRLTLLPERKQRFRTSNGKGISPVFNEEFEFRNVQQEKLSSAVIRFRLYRPFGKGKRDQPIGECALQLCLIDARSESPTHHLLDLSLRSLGSALSDAEFSGDNRRQSALNERGQYCSQPRGVAPELSLSLCFNDITGKLSVGIDKGSHFGVHTKNPDTYVKVTVLSPYGDEIGQGKTGTRKSCANPVFSDTFVFQVPLSELQYVSVLVQVYCLLGVWRRKMALGWLSIGQNSTAPMQESHWKEMVQGMGITLSKWHTLQEP